MAKIFHASLHGLSQAKDQALLASDIGKTEWSDVDLEASSFYLLIPQNSDLRREYDQFWKITEIMKTNVLGFQTHRDHFAIDFDRDELFCKIQEMFDQNTSDHNYTQKYSLKDNRDWNISEARKELRSDNEWQNKLVDCLYRPFDKRYCYFSTVSMDYPRRELVNHVMDKDNLCLLSSRQQATLGYRHCWVTKEPAESCVISTTSREGNQVFPLYLYPTTPGEIKMGVTRTPNFSAEFLTRLEQNIGCLPTPEDIFHYMYAILNSPTYRNRYAEFLKIDFPSIPITRNVDLFRQLGELGEQLVNLHLMKSPILNQTSSPFINNGGGCIVDAGHPKYESGKVVINKQKDGFMDVPEDVWNFHVGGYQVCQKWLKDRKGRTLSQDDIEHYQKIVVALGQSISLMRQIDEAIPSWPMDAEYN
jgi:predicted helicase